MLSVQILDRMNKSRNCSNDLGDSGVTWEINRGRHRFRTIIERVNNSLTTSVQTSWHKYYWAYKSTSRWISVFRREREILRRRSERFNWTDQSIGWTVVSGTEFELEVSGPRERRKKYFIFFYPRRYTVDSTKPFKRPYAPSNILCAFNRCVIIVMLPTKIVAICSSPQETPNIWRPVLKVHV